MISTRGHWNTVLCLVIHLRTFPRFWRKKKGKKKKKKEAIVGTHIKSQFHRNVYFYLKKDFTILDLNVCIFFNDQTHGINFSFYQILLTEIISLSIHIRSTIMLDLISKVLQMKIYHYLLISPLNQ